MEDQDGGVQATRSEAISPSLNPSTSSSPSPSTSTSTSTTTLSLSKAAKRHKAMLLLGGGVVLLLILLVVYMVSQFSDLPTPKTPPQVIDTRDPTRRTYTLTWSKDAVDPKPIITVSPPFATLRSLAATEATAIGQRSRDIAAANGIRDVNVQTLFSFEPNVSGVQCTLNITNLNKSIYQGIVTPRIVDNVFSGVYPKGMHSSAMRRLAVTPRWSKQGETQNVLTQVALWLTPHGLMIGDPKLDAKVTAKRFAAPEVLNVYGVTSVSPDAHRAPSGGAENTTPDDLLHISNDNMPVIMRERPLHFRSAPFAMWTIARGNLGALANTDWPFAPTVSTTKVVWSDNAPTDHSTRWLEFLENGELRIVDRDTFTGDLQTVLWTASSDRRTDVQAGSGCV